MSKYIWKCESCGEKFEAENPNQCPKCGHDDILIIGEPQSNIPWKKILIAVDSQGRSLGHNITFTKNCTV